jgi:hypothetical protein
MADRIFPTQIQGDGLDSEKVFTGINWDDFGSRLAQVREAEGTEMSPEVREYLDSLKNDESDFAYEDDVTAENESSNVTTAKRELPEALVEHQFKSKDEDENDEQEESKIVRGKEASAQNRRVVFSSAKQLTAEAIEEAKAKGDQGLVNAILAARNDRRTALAAKIAEAAKEQVDKNVRIAERNAYRMSIVNSVEETSKKITEAAASNNTKVASDNDGFVKISDLKGQERQAFIKKCASQGFPEEYVSAMLGETLQANADFSAEADNIRQVMSADLDKNIKKSAVEGMVKVSSLDKAEYDRLKRYWKEELGYGDEEWIDDLFSSKYDSKK